MANAVYPLYKQELLQGSANTSLTGTVKVALVDTSVYTYSAAHQFLSSVSGIIGTAQTLASKTFTNGTFDAADPTFTAVTGASAEALVFYVDTGVAGTSRLIAYIDTGYSNLPITPNGGDITVQFAAGGIFTI